MGRKELLLGALLRKDHSAAEHGKASSPSQCPFRWEEKPFDHRFANSGSKGVDGRLPLLLILVPLLKPHFQLPQHTNWAAHSKGFALLTFKKKILSKEFSKNMKRADIQGLRTLAILAVLFYHIWPLVFPSGFLGVDV